MIRTILLTGASGFVGRQVFNALQSQSIRVRLVVRKGKEFAVLKGQFVDDIVYTEDIFSESVEWFSKICEGIDTVVHTAWYTEPGKYLQSSINLECLKGTLNFAQGAEKAKVRRFVGIGTCFEYDLKLGTLSLDTPLKPTTAYAATKVAIYTTLSQWLPTQNVQFLWCRLFYLYGQGENSSRFVAYLRSQLERGLVVELTSGKQIRDFMDVQEAGRRIAEEALSERQGCVNICSGIPVTIRQFAEKVADEYGRRDLLKFGARRENIVDPPCVLGINDVKTL